jgi:hypothetical protein
MVEVPVGALGRSARGGNTRTRIFVLKDFWDYDVTSSHRTISHHRDGGNGWRWSCLLIFLATQYVGVNVDGRKFVRH